MVRAGWDPETEVVDVCGARFWACREQLVLLVQNLVELGLRALRVDEARGHALLLERRFKPVAPARITFLDQRNNVC